MSIKTWSSRSPLPVSKVMMARRASFPREYPRRMCGCKVFCIIIGALALMTTFLFVLETRPTNFLGDVAVSFFGSEYETYYERLNTIQDVPALIELIQNATRKAADRSHHKEGFSEVEKANWQKRYPCKSRTEMESFYSRRQFVKHIKRNSKWVTVLNEYQKLHRTCMRKVGPDVTSYFLTRNETTGCKFVVAGGPSWAGLGNKVLPTLAVLLYAVLTQRVLLVPMASRLPEIMCEPFEGSSWGVDPEGLFTPVETHDQLWTSHSSLEAMVDNVTSHNQYRPKLYAVRAAHWCQPVPRFFCDVEQDFYKDVTWMYFTSCVDFTPKLFAIPAFRPVLEDLFHDKVVTTHLARSIMMPSEAVWKRVKNWDKTYLEHADRRVGIQIRYRDLQPQFDRYHNMVNNNVLQCAWKFGILPPINGSMGMPKVITKGQNEGAHKRLGTTPSKTSVFVTSLFESLHGHLSDVYQRNPPTSRDNVEIFQLSHGTVQGFGLEEDVQALTEVLCLSFSDDLFVTPLSTFGGLAQAYGALTPYFLEFQNDSSLSPCQRGPSIGACYQDPEKRYSCPHEPKLNRKLISTSVPYVKDCPIIDVTNGLVLISHELVVSKTDLSS